MTRWRRFVLVLAFGAAGTLLTFVPWAAGTGAGRVRPVLAAAGVLAALGIAFYAAGAGLALLLDEHAPGWRHRYLERKFALEGLLP